MPNIKSSKKAVKVIEKKTLNPLEKTDFMFKVFKFSSQVARVIVDFVDESKI